MSDYTDAVIAQAADRAHFKPRTIEEYFYVRRENGAIRPCLHVLEFDLDLPAEVLENEIIAEVFFHATTLVIIDNVSGLAHIIRFVSNAEML